MLNYLETINNNLFKIKIQPSPMFGSDFLRSMLTVIGTVVTLVDTRPNQSKWYYESRTH